jgi:hypothetical protein
MLTTLARLREIAAGMPAALDRVARTPETQRESSYYLARIRDLKTLDAFMADDRVLRFALRSFGLEDMAYAKAFVRRLLSEGIDRRDSLANRLADPRFRELVETFNFTRHGAATTAFARAQQGTVDRYLRQALEAEVGNTSEGARLALYFQRKAPGVTSPYGLMADRALLTVTQIALGLPSSTGALGLDRQAELIEQRLDTADLKRPEKLDKLLTRFAALWDAGRSLQAAAAGVVMASSPAPAAIAADQLLQLQTMRK